MTELGRTKRGVPVSYDGEDPRLCNARTKSGRPCRALKLEHGRCKWHGGLSTGPKTAAGKARALACLKQYQKFPHRAGARARMSARASKLTGVARR
jgi:hypothetical protein